MEERLANHPINSLSASPLLFKYFTDYVVLPRNRTGESPICFITAPLSRSGVRGLKASVSPCNHQAIHFASSNALTYLTLLLLLSIKWTTKLSHNQRKSTISTLAQQAPKLSAASIYTLHLWDEDAENVPLLRPS